MILFRNVRIMELDPPSVSEPMDVAVFEPEENAHGGTIAEIGGSLQTKYPKAKIAGEGGFLSPGLVCGHTHLYSALSRGMLVDIAPSKDFAQLLKNLWWRLDRAIDPEILRASALAGCSDALKAGVTSLVDHHAGPECIADSLSIIRKAYEDTGLRGILCYETTDRNGTDEARAGIAENIRFAKEVDDIRASGQKPLVDAAIGAHASFTLSNETLEALAEAVQETDRGIHIHLAEDKFDAVDARYRFGKDPVERLEAVGALNSRGIVGHGVWLTPSEIEIMNVRDVFLAHNARSNMNNAVGYNALLPTFKNVVLGTDGMGADMLEEFKFAVFRHRESQGPWWPGDFLKALHRGNLLIERYFSQDFDPTSPGFGTIKQGAPADLVLWDYDPPTPLVGANIAGHLAFGMSSRSARTVMIAGSIRILDHRPMYDDMAIEADARCQAARLWKRMEER
ncbi:MAG TPA: putative aminohydrolase SsnA [Rectinema sp.]|nr:putative aminohydrolase SsnA [Spirochaetota bacterium]HNZ93753.1 putative aminohydrolase SsnA [Rectinema sp.]